MHEHASPTKSVTDKSTTGPSFAIYWLELMAFDGISHAAKTVYCRLSLYAGKNGICNPSQATLAKQTAVNSVRQLQRHLAELHAVGLITWKRTRSSSSYTVNSPEVLRRDKSVVSDATDMSCLETTDVSYKKMLMNTCSGKDVDLDCSFSGENEAVDISPVEGLRFQKLKAALGRYRSGSNSTPPEMLPNDATVAEIMHAAGGRSEHWVLLELDHLYFGRGFAWGKRGGPYSWKWFPKVIGQRCAEANEREYLMTPDEIWNHDGTRRVN